MFSYCDAINLYVKGRITRDDAVRQERTAREILHRLADQPGLILADEVGMGKTFVALAVAASAALGNRGRHPVVVMTPPALKEKWPADFHVFREFCAPAIKDQLNYGRAESAEQFLKLIDDPPGRRKAVIFVTHGAMSRGLTDPWIKLALIYRAIHRRKDGNSIRRALARNEVIPGLLRWSRMRRQPEELWLRLLTSPTKRWLEVLKSKGIDPEGDDNSENDDDPVPRAVRRALPRIDTDDLYDVLQNVPLRTSANLKQRVDSVRAQLSDELPRVWRKCVQLLEIKLPLLILDEAHHLKNADTRLAALFGQGDTPKLFGHIESLKDSKELGERGALYGVFDRMLFLTATPFQLGHAELCSVLERFQGIRWKGAAAPPDGEAQFAEQLKGLRKSLDDGQQAAVALDHSWGRLTEDDLAISTTEFRDVAPWWQAAQTSDDVSARTRDVVHCYRQARQRLAIAEEQLRPWVIRHLKPRFLPAPHAEKTRRQKLVGRAILDELEATDDSGLLLDGEALLPFLLAARATAHVPESRPVFAEGLASCYAAFLETRRAHRDVGHDGETPIDEDDEDRADLNKLPLTDAATWYLDQLERVLGRGDAIADSSHPKVRATVQRVVESWRAGEKSLVFCHYVVTGRVLRQRISEALRNEIARRAADSLNCDETQAADELERLGKRFFDEDSPARRQCNEEVNRILDGFPNLADSREQWSEIVRRNVRTPSFLVRYFRLSNERLGADEVIEAFDVADQSGLTLRQVLQQFFGFLENRCSAVDRDRYRDALLRVQTGSHVAAEIKLAFDPDELFARDNPERLVPNVRLVNGRAKSDTRQRLMLTFNTPFYPEVLIASSVMAEGVDLHRNCRHVIHHDLCWNPSTLEQRTGRIDRIGCKAEESGQPIRVYLPYISATQDEKMYRVVMDRERWFGVVMGERYQVDARTTERLAERIPFPLDAANELAFRLEVAATDCELVQAHSVSQTEDSVN